MINRWYPANFCPKAATCSMDDALSPSNGHKIQGMKYPSEEQPILGEIRNFNQEFPAKSGFNWAKCDGQLLPIAPHTMIFQILANSYGGDERTDFGLPNLSDDTSGDYRICLDGVQPGFFGP